MRYRIRTLLILVIIGGPALGWIGGELVAYWQRPIWIVIQPGDGLKRQFTSGVIPYDVEPVEKFMPIEVENDRPGRE